MVRSKERHSLEQTKQHGMRRETLLCPRALQLTPPCALASSPSTRRRTLRLRPHPGAPHIHPALGRTGGQEPRGQEPAVELPRPSPPDPPRPIPAGVPGRASLGNRDTPVSLREALAAGPQQHVCMGGKVSLPRCGPPPMPCASVAPSRGRPWTALRPRGPLKCRVQWVSQGLEPLGEAGAVGAGTP